MDHGKPGGTRCAWMPAAMGTGDMALLGFVCVIFFLAYGSSAPVRIKHAGVMAAWITGVLARYTRGPVAMGTAAMVSLEIFLLASGSWHSKGLLGWSFCVA